MTAIERNADGTYNYHPGVTRDDVVDLYKQRSETYDDVSLSIHSDFLK